MKTGETLERGQIVFTPRLTILPFPLRVLIDKAMQPDYEYHNEFMNLYGVKYKELNSKLDSLLDQKEKLYREKFGSENYNSVVQEIANVKSTLQMADPAAFSLPELHFNDWIINGSPVMKAAKQLHQSLEVEYKAWETLYIKFEKQKKSNGKGIKKTESLLKRARDKYANAYKAYATFLDSATTEQNFILFIRAQTLQQPYPQQREKLQGGATDELKSWDDLFETDEIKEAVIEAMKVLQITKRNGKSKLHEKRLSALLGFIDALKPEVLGDYPDRILTELFCQKIGIKYSRLKRDPKCYEEMKDRTRDYMNTNHSAFGYNVLK